MLMYGSNFWMVMLYPRACNSFPKDAEIIPLPNDDATPPVMKMYLVSINPLLLFVVCVTFYLVLGVVGLFGVIGIVKVIDIGFYAIVTFRSIVFNSFNFFNSFNSFYFPNFSNSFNFPNFILQFPLEVFLIFRQFAFADVCEAIVLVVL